MATEALASMMHLRALRPGGKKERSDEREVHIGRAGGEREGGKGREGGRESEGR